MCPASSFGLIDVVASRPYLCICLSTTLRLLACVGQAHRTWPFTCLTKGDYAACGLEAAELSAVAWNSGTLQ